MKNDYLDKRYIFFRDSQRCYYCNKLLKIKHITLDHYQPRSLGGTDDYFNLVTCCKRCNKFKGKIVPTDVEAIQLKLFKRAINDCKIISRVKNVNQKSLERMLNYTTSIECMGSIAEIRGDDFTLYIEKNKVIRADGNTLEYINRSFKDEN